MKIPLPRLQRSKKSQNLLRVEFSQVFCFLRLLANNECMSVTSVFAFWIFLQHSFLKNCNWRLLSFAEADRSSGGRDEPEVEDHFPGSLEVRDEAGRRDGRVAQGRARPFAGHRSRRHGRFLRSRRRTRQSRSEGAFSC